MENFLYVYIFMLAAFTGYEVISRVPVILHTPLMSGSNFVHGVVLVGAMVALGRADPYNPLQLAIGFFAVFLGAAMQIPSLLQIEADDIIALSNALLIFQRNRILELEARVKNFSKIQSSLKQIEQLASYPREQVAMRHLALIQKIAHRSRSSA